MKDWLPFIPLIGLFLACPCYYDDQKVRLYWSSLFVQIGYWIAILVYVLLYHNN